MFGKTRAGIKQHDMAHLFHGLLINVGPVYTEGKARGFADAARTAHPPQRLPDERSAGQLVRW